MDFGKDDFPVFQGKMFHQNFLDSYSKIFLHFSHKTKSQLGLRCSVLFSLKEALAVP